MQPSVTPSRNTLTNCLGAFTKFPTTHTTKRPSTAQVSTRFTCWENRGSPARIGFRAVPAPAVIGLPQSFSSSRREGLHQVGRRRQHVMGDELAALDDIDRH